MPEIGIRELKAHGSEIVRRVREEKATYDVTYRGRVVARIVPAKDHAFDQSEFRRVWAEMDELAKDISESWPEGVSAVDAVREQRR